MEWGVDKAADKLAGDKQEEIKKMHIIIPKRKDVPACAKVYLAAYQADPWNETYEPSEVESYIGNYLDSDVKCCYALVEGEEIRGVALGLVVPSIDSPYLRIEDICVDPGVQRKGYGSQFMELLSQQAARRGCDSVLLGTQRDYPSHRFYLKNGFQEIESVLLYKEVRRD